jgi:histidine ammonia-lyase
MTYYRLYFFGGGNGPIANVRELEMIDDVTAIVAAERLRGMAAMELWCQGRKVRRWEPVGASSARSLASRYFEVGSSRLASP